MSEAPKITMPEPVAQLRVFDIPGDGDGSERHAVAEALHASANLPVGNHALCTQPSEQDWAAPGFSGCTTGCNWKTFPDPPPQ